MGSVPRSTCFKVTKWILVVLIAIATASLIFNTHQRWGELEKMRKSGNSNEVLMYVFYWIHIGIWIFGLIGILFEQYGLVMSLASLFVVGVVFNIVQIIRDYSNSDKTVMPIDWVTLVIGLAVVILSCFYAYRIDAEGGSACQVC